MSRPVSWAVAGAAAFLVALITATLLLGVGVSTRGALVGTYFVYALTVVIALHCCAFGLPLWLEFRWSRRAPKYLDYAYILIILVSLLDILNFAPRYYVYLMAQGGSEASLLEKIAAEAEQQVRENCGKGLQIVTAGTVVVATDYPPEYCGKLATLAREKPPKAAALKLARDAAFLGQVVTVTTSVSDRGDTYVSSLTNPIAGLVQRVAMLDTFAGYTADAESEATLKWLALILLPLGIGLRMVKTSLELFAELV